MLEWALLVYAVNTHQLLAEWPHRYPLKELCEADREAATIPAKTYAICQPANKCDGAIVCARPGDYDHTGRAQS